MGELLILFGIGWAIIGVVNIYLSHYLASGHSSGPWFNIVVFVIPGLGLAALGELGRLAWWPRARTTPGDEDQEGASWEVVVYDPSRSRDALRPILLAHRPELSDTEIASLLDSERLVVAADLSPQRAAELERELRLADPAMRTARARSDPPRAAANAPGPDPSAEPPRDPT